MLFASVTNQDNSLISEPSAEPPELRGYLNKYTNVAKGYNARWFVLHNGVLSCKSLGTSAIEPMFIDFLQTTDTRTMRP